MKTNITQNFLIAIAAIIVSAIAGIIIAKTGAWAIAAIPLLVVIIFVGKQIFLNPFFGFLLIIFFLPFERVPTFPLAGVDIKINTLLGFLTIITWILALLFNGKKWKIQPNALFIPICLFIIALLFSLTQAVNLSRAVQVLIFVLFTISLSVMSVSMIDNISNLRKIVLVLLFSSVIVGLFGLFQFAGDVVGLPKSITLLKKGYTSIIFGFPRIQAFSMEPLYYANYLLIPLSLALSYFFSKTTIIKRWWLIGILVLLLINFTLTVSRGGYLGLLVTLLLFFFFYIRQIFTWKSLAIVLLVFVVAGGVMFALSKGKNQSLKSFTKQATLQDAKKGSESVQGRLYEYERALKAYDRYPVFGIGLGNYGPYSVNYPDQTPKTGWNIVNNEYIEILVETGLVGAFCYGLILLVLLLRSLLAIRRADDPFLKATMFALFAAFCGILVQYNFFSTLYIIHIWILIGLMVGVQNLILRKNNT